MSPGHSLSGWDLFVIRTDFLTESTLLSLAALACLVASALPSVYLDYLTVLLSILLERCSLANAVALMVRCPCLLQIVRGCRHLKLLWLNRCALAGADAAWFRSLS